MPFEPIFETITPNQKCGIITDQLKVECKTDVSSDKVAKIINLSAFPQIVEASARQNQAKYGGKATFFICYEDESGEIKKTECGAEFVGAVNSDELCDDARIIATVKCQKTEAILSGTTMSCVAYLAVELSVVKNGCYTALTGGDGLIVDTKQISYAKSLGVKKTSYPIDEEFEVSYKILEVINQNAKAVVTSAQCGVGIIIVDGEVYFSAIFLQSEDKRDIIRENRRIPFKVEIECEDAMPANGALARVFVKSLKTDISVDAENQRGTVTASISLGFYGEAFSEESAGLAQDVFCLAENLQIGGEDAFCSEILPMRSISVGVRGTANIEEIPIGGFFSAATGERAEIISTEKTESGIRVEGTFAVNGIFSGGDGKVFSRKAETPFEVTLDCPLDCADFELCVEPCKAQAKITSLTALEIEGELIFTLYPTQTRRIRCIKEVASAGEKVAEDCAISVFIPQEGEELWSLAKRLNICPDDLVATNKELQFPLTGKERIVIYRNR